MSYTRLRQIVVSDTNYNMLKHLGQAGDSFNDVIDKILNQIQSSQKKHNNDNEIVAVQTNSRVGRSAEQSAIATTGTKTTEDDSSHG